MSKQEAFDLITEISPGECAPEALCLTFDMDWVCDDIANDVIDLLERHDVKATWFITHDTPVIDRLKGNSNFEVGIHPNFEPLLSGAVGGGSPAEVIDRLLDIVPGAKVVRSHSLVQSSRIQDLFVEKGLLYDCNHFIPAQAGIELYSWILWNGLIKVPFFWADDVACMYESWERPSELKSKKGLKVFSFHPIHVFLNTESLSRYEKTRHLHHDASALLKHRYSGYGVRSFLEELLT